MGVKKQCSRCERFMVFNVKTESGVCLRSMNVVPGSDICDNYTPKPRRKRGAKDGKADSSAEGNR